MAEMAFEDLRSLCLRDSHSSSIEISSLKQEIHRLREEISDLSEENAFLQHENQSLEEQIDSFQSANLIELQTIIEELRTNWEESSRRQKEMRLEIELLSQERDLWRNRAEMNSEDWVRCEAHTAQIADLQYKCQSFCSQIPPLQSHLQASTSKISSLQAQLHSLRLSVRRHEEDLLLRSHQLEYLRQQYSLSDSVDLNSVGIEVAQLKLLSEKHSEMRELLASSQKINEKAVQRIENIKKTFVKIIEKQRLLESVCGANGLTEAESALLSLEMKAVDLKLDVSDLFRTDDLEFSPVSFQARFDAQELLPSEELAEHYNETKKLQREIDALRLTSERYEQVQELVSSYYPENDTIETVDKLLKVAPRIDASYLYTDNSP